LPLCYFLSRIEKKQTFINKKFVCIVFLKESGHVGDMIIMQVMERKELVQKFWALTSFKQHNTILILFRDLRSRHHKMILKG